jgi:hypothetical protein
MNESTRFFYIFSVLTFIILISFISGCDKSEVPKVTNDFNVENIDSAEIINDATFENQTNQETKNNQDSIPIIEESEATSDTNTNASATNATTHSTCITTYPMFYTDSKGVYRSTEIRLENYSISSHIGENDISMYFGPRMQTVNPDEERYARVGGYYRVLPQDASACSNPELIFNTYSIAFCNITEIEPILNRKAYQAEILIYNHSVPGCITNPISERRVWLGCGDDSTPNICVLEAFTEERFYVTANQNTDDEIKNITLRINYGDYLPIGLNYKGYDFKYSYYTTATAKVATDSLLQMTYKIEIVITLKNGKQEIHERQLRISPSKQVSEFLYSPECWSEDITIKKDTPVILQNRGEFTLKYMFRTPQMIYLDSKNIGLPWAMGYGSERSSAYWTRITSFDYDKQQVTLQIYTPSCNDN